MVGLEQVSHAGHQRLPQRLRPDPKRGEHRRGGAGAVGVQQRQQQVILPDPVPEAVDSAGGKSGADAASSRTRPRVIPRMRAASAAVADC